MCKGVFKKKIFNTYELRAKRDFSRASLLPGIHEVQRSNMPITIISLALCNFHVACTQQTYSSYSFASKRLKDV